MPPITPDDAKIAQMEAIPEAVFEAFNQLIVEKITANGTATISQRDATRAVRAAGVSTEEAFRKGWFDVEPAYRAAGWHVEYDKAGYNEPGDDYYKFKKDK